MPKLPNASFPPEIFEIMQRIFRIRDRFRAGVPENIAILKKRLLEANLGGKSGHFNGFDLFHNVGLIFSGHDGPITMGELSRDLNIPLSTATRTVDWFVENGYAQRFPDPQDRRIVRVGLTESGQEVYAAINQLFLERTEKLLSQLTPEERKTFIALLFKVFDGLDAPE